MKTALISLILFLFCTFSFAQKIGIKAGGNFTNVVGKDGKGDKADGHQYVPGFHVGIFGELDLAQTISVQTEVVYSTKGFRQKSSTSTTVLTTTVVQDFNVLYSYSYIDIPFLLNIHFGQMGSYIGLGPQLSFLAGAKWDGGVTNTTTNSSTTPPTITTLDLTIGGNDKSEYSPVDFAVVFGTGSKWESGVEYCLRAGYGLSNLVNSSVSASGNVWHNLVFSVSLGYGFGIGGGGGKDRYGRRYKK